MTARVCRWCYSTVIGGGECLSCKDDHARKIHRGFFVGGKKGRPTLDVQEGNREEYFGDDFSEIGGNQ